MAKLTAKKWDWVRCRRALVALVVVAVFAASASVVAGTVDELSQTLKSSKNEKARISAAVSLAKLKDRRAVPALAHALRDRSQSVRAIAATALGELADPRALKALREAAADSNDTVKRRAAAAISRIEENERRARSEAAQQRLRRYKVAAQEPPLMQPRKPELLVTLKSTADKSRGRHQKRTRMQRANRMKSLMMRELRGTRSITLEAEQATEMGLPSYIVDASILKLDRRVDGALVEIECEIRLAISNDRGKMISFLTGGAKVQVPRSTFRRRYVPQMQREALENAVRNVHRDLVSFLRKAKG